MKTIDLQESQRIILDILKETTKICDNLNLKYYLAYGTLLGAIRHKGFIPWDDDIDIVMPREDYEVFLREFSRNSNNRYRLLHYSNKNNICTVFAKIEDTRTILIQPGSDSEKDNSGLFIDIFPLDMCGDFYPPTLIYYHCCILPFLILYRGEHISLEKKRFFLKTLIVFWVKKLCTKYDVEKFMVIADSLAKHCCKRKTSKLVTSFLAGYGKHEIHEAKWYGEGIIVDFENSHFRVPQDYDSVLKTVYGNYMQLPPKEKQKPKHTICAYWREK